MKKLIIIFTVRKRSCGKLMFSQACVKNSVHGGVSQYALGQTTAWSDTLPWSDTPWQTLLWSDTPPPWRPLQRTVRNASYWNAFLWHHRFNVSYPLLTNPADPLMWDILFRVYLFLCPHQLVNSVELRNLNYTQTLQLSPLFHTFAEGLECCRTDIRRCLISSFLLPLLV